MSDAPVTRTDAASTRRARGSRRKETAAAPLLDRSPPCSLEAEERLLSCMLMHGAACDEITHIVVGDDFVHEPHRILFSEIMQMRESSTEIDVPLLVDRLRTQDLLDRIGGLSTLARIAESVPHSAFARDYARVIQQYAQRRRLIDACTESLLEAYDSEEPAEQVVGRAEHRIFEIAVDRSGQDIQSLSEALDHALDELDARLSHSRGHDGVESGFVDLDEITAGFHRGELTILAARPSMGKTALALNIAEHVAIDLQRAVLFVSLEMSSLELTNRLICSRARVDGHRMRRGRLSSSDKAKLVDEAGRIAHSPLFIDDATSRNLTQIAASARRVQRAANTDLALIVVDYLQLIEPDNPRDPRQEQVARIARRLKAIARELRVPVLCLAQLNRQAEQSQNNRPRLSHLRESGAIEQDADVVIFIHREEFNLAGDERAQHEGRASVIVAKQRNGPRDDAELFFHNSFARFENAEKRHTEPDYRALEAADHAQPGPPGRPF